MNIRLICLSVVQHASLPARSPSFGITDTSTMRASLLAGAIAAVLPVVSGYGAFMRRVSFRYNAKIGIWKVDK